MEFFGGRHSEGNDPRFQVRLSCDALRSLISVTNWRLYDRLNATNKHFYLFV